MSVNVDLVKGPQVVVSAALRLNLLLLLINAYQVVKCLIYICFISAGQFCPKPCNFSVLKLCYNYTFRLSLSSLQPHLVNSFLLSLKPLASVKIKCLHVYMYMQNIPKYNQLHLIISFICIFSGLMNWYWITNCVLCPGEDYFFHSQYALVFLTSLWKVKVSLAFSHLIQHSCWSCTLLVKFTLVRQEQSLTYLRDTL